MTPTNGGAHQLVVQGLRAGVTSREVLAGIDLVVRTFSIACLP